MVGETANLPAPLNFGSTHGGLSRKLTYLRDEKLLIGTQNPQCIIIGSKLLIFVPQLLMVKCFNLNLLSKIFYKLNSFA